ncbi:ATP-binding protein [Desulfatiferula olefinivorans]
MIHDTRRSTVIYLLLLIVPTLILGGAGLRLLVHEKDRIRTQALASLTDRAGALAESLVLTVSEVEAGLTRSLSAMNPDRLEADLRTWQETHPLVRNVFVWTDSGLVYPPDSPAATAEERRFIRRYEALFTGRLAWDFGSPDRMNEPFAPSVSSSYGGELRRMSEARRDLLNLAKDGPIQAGADSDMRWGFIPWFAENQLFILGWVKREKDGPVYGLELETMALLSRLIAQMPVINDDHAAYALIGGDGRLLHQSGAFPVSADQKPAVSVPLSGLLPHYRIAFYLSGPDLTGGRGLVMVAGMFLILATAALFTGGLLLIRDSLRSMKDAMEKTSFVSNVSHELKTPLTTIRMYAELLREGRVTSPEKTGHYLSVIVSESRRLTRLVNNVLDFGKLEQGRKHYTRAPLDLSAVVRQIIEAHGDRLLDAGLSVHLTLPDEPVVVSSDRDALEQVMLNLLDNAVKYAADGHWLGVELGNASDGRGVELRIRDRGPGIPPGHRSRIFETFHRVDNSLTAGQAGSGLGLSIARRIMRDLKGDILYQPEADGGSCFRVRILS